MESEEWRVLGMEECMESREWCVLGMEECMESEERCVCLRSSLVPTCYSWRPTRDISAFSDVPDRSGTSPCPREVTCVS